MKLAASLITCLLGLSLSSVTSSCPESHGKEDHHRKGQHYEGHHKGGQHKQCQDGQCPHKKPANWSAQLQLTGEQAEQIDALQKQFKIRRQELTEEQHMAWKNLQKEQQMVLAELLSADEIQQLHQHHDHHSTKICPHH